MLALPETLPWLVLRAREREHERRKDEAPLPAVREEVAGQVNKPVMEAPWAPLRYLVEAALAPYFGVLAALFGGLFVSFTVFRGILSAPPFSLSPAAVGAAYLPSGVALWAGSLLGGSLSDSAGLARPGAPTARLFPSLVGAFSMPIGLLIFGWVAWAAAPSADSATAAVSPGGALGAILVGHTLIGFGQAMYGPGFYAYISGEIAYRRRVICLGFCTIHSLQLRNSLRLPRREPLRLR